MSACRNTKAQRTALDASGTFLFDLLEEMFDFAKTNSKEIDFLITEGEKKWDEYEDSLTDVDDFPENERGKIPVIVESMAILLQNHHDKFKAIRDRCKAKIDEINPDTLASRLATLPHAVSEQTWKARMKLYSDNLRIYVKSAEDGMAECLNRKEGIQEELQVWRKEQEETR